MQLLQSTAINIPRHPTPLIKVKQSSLSPLAHPLTQLFSHHTTPHHNPPPHHSPGTAMTHFSSAVLLLLAASIVVDGRDTIRLPSESSRFFSGDISNDGDDDSVGTRWVVLLEGSSGYWNYRHQADVRHAYQLLKKGGKPQAGVIINSPHGSDVYSGVPKDYIGDEVTVNNFFAVILGNKTALTGGSGKVVDSGPNDHIFIYYMDHGGPGVLGMPTTPYIYVDNLIVVLKKKHASGTYKSLVFYLEACESGSIFEGLLPEGLNIYATTASNAEESSWGTYCPGEYPSPPVTCIVLPGWRTAGCDIHNLQTQTLRQQYELVKDRTSNDNSAYGSHVMQYGDLGLNADHIFLYMGTNPANDNYTFVDDNVLQPSSRSKAVNQCDADLLHFWHKFQKAPEGSPRKLKAQKELVEAVSHRMHIDNSMKMIGKHLFGIEKGPEVLQTVRPGRAASC
ncbi:unnamed protein product [Camellia sinensis]